MIELTLDHDKVIIEGVTIPRPARIAPSQWLTYWERLLDKAEEK